MKYFINPYLLRRYFFCFFLFAHLQTNALEGADFISMVRVEAQGSNSSQAKNRALNQGRTIALKLFINKNKIKITNDELRNIPFTALQECFQVDSIPKEDQFPNHYRAEVNYKHSLTNTIDMLAKHVPRLANLAPKQTYLLPIFKRNKKCHYANTQWHDAWKSIAAELTDHKIVLLKNEDVITKRLLMGQNYSQISQALQISSNKTIAIATGEFSFHENGEVYFDSSYRILTKNAETTHNQQLLFHEHEEQKDVMKKSAESFINLVRIQAIK